MMRRWLWMAVALGAAAAVTWAASRSVDRTPSRLILLFSGEQEGYLLPCGCTKGMLGGIDRRATVVRNIRAEGVPVLILDNGGFINGVLEQERLKRTFLLQSMLMVGYNAAGVGKSDLVAGLGGIVTAARNANIPVVSANVLRIDGSRPFKTDMIIKAGGVRVGVTAAFDEGLIESGSPVRQEVTFADPVEALAKVLDGWKDRTDLAVLLYHGPGEKAVRLAGKLPDFDLIITGYRNDLEVKKMARVGRTWIVTTGVHGKYLGRLDVGGSDRAAFTRMRSIPLPPEVDKDPDMRDMIDLYRSILGDRWEELVVKRKKRLPDRQRFVASRLCGTCHKTAWAKLQTVEHFKAMGTLKDDGSDKDPECVYCHVVGLEFKTGYYDMRRTPEHGFVGCDSCHGYGSEHMQNPVMETAPKAEPEMSCLNCHNVEHSPDFDYKIYHPKVAHPTPPEEREELRKQ